MPLSFGQCISITWLGKETKVEKKAALHGHINALETFKSGGRNPRKPCGTVVKLQYCSKDSAHNLSSILGSGSWFKDDLAFHPSKASNVSI